jgi:predicted molibdopterin-dependent oxidoreductase YjgC
MRQNGTANSKQAKVIARQKYAERQIDKWVKWSWENRNKIIYKELIEIQTQYGINCYG